MRSCTIALIAVLLLCGSVAKADISSWEWWGEPGISCTPGTYTNLSKAVDGSYIVPLPGVQSGPGGMVSIITTTSDDPAATILHDITNDTGSAWTGYTGDIKLYSNVSLSSLLLSNALVTLPADWSATVDASFASVSSDNLALGSHEYVGHITYSANTPTAYVADGSDLDFQYKETFTGSTHYTQVEELSPVYAVPEPGTFALLGAAAIGLLAFRRQWKKA